MTFESIGCISSVYASHDADSKDFDILTLAECESTVKSAHAISFHIFAALALVTLIQPFLGKLTLKSLYMFSLCYEKRLQVLALTVGSAASVTLFALREAFEWDMFQAVLTFVLKATWVLVFWLSYREFKLKTHFGTFAGMLNSSNVDSDSNINIEDVMSGEGGLVGGVL